MRSIVGGIILALLLFAAGVASWNEAALTRRAADAHARLATLHYDGDDLETTRPFWDRLPVKIGSASQNVARHRATAAYWALRYDSLVAMTGITGDVPASDPALLFVAANAAFRKSAIDPVIDRRTSVERLDRVAQSYGDVLRADPEHGDAAYNYEYVSRVRDALATALPSARAARDAKKAPAAENASPDLPPGPTLHGRPGGPPEGTDMSDFKTLSPIRYDEREEQTTPSRGLTIKRKG